ncbi:MAG: hypothetical protein KBT36_10330 [Kurthia sp.]|nr:hypothetical protein [Candidatus Kurthia equi]
MKKLIAWVLFFALILGSINIFQYAVDRPEFQNTFHQLKDTLSELQEEKQPETKHIVLKDTAGKQQGTYTNEYDESWTMTHTAYKNFTLQMPKFDGGYIAGSGRKLFSMTIGVSTMDATKKMYGEPLKNIQKGNTLYSMSEKSNEEMAVYEIDGYYVTFFYDLHNNGKLRAIHYVKQAVEQSKPGFYAPASEQLRLGFEELMIELMNQSRVEQGLQPFKYDKGLTAEARQHSEDMAEKNYFSHTGSDGSSPQMRMKAAGYTQEHFYAENLAYGQYSSIFAHEGLMNSLGHRENILNKNLTHAGVGVAFNENNIPYYTINFYTPF